MSPLLAWAYTLYDTNLIHLERDFHLMSWSADFNGKIITRALPDYKTYKKDRFNDKELVRELYTLMGEAKIVVGHNGDKFDIRKTQARMIFHGMKPPPEHQTIDTLKIARKNFAFTSNKLGDLAEHLGVGRKTKETHGDLWRDCLSGDMKAWKKMKLYNRKDVILTKGVYLKMRAWHKGHPNLALHVDKPHHCPVCTSRNLTQRGYRFTKTGQAKSYLCKDCGKYSQGQHTKLTSIR